MSQEPGETDSLDNFLREAAVNRVDVFGQSTARFRFDLLNFLESATRYKQSACFGVVWQHFAELADDVLEYIRRSVVQQRLECR